MCKWMWLMLSVSIFFSGQTTLPAEENAAKIPDFSQVSRGQVPVEFTWKMEDIYPSYEEWLKDKEAISGLMARIDVNAAGWTESAQKMLAMLDLVDEIDRKREMLYSYAGNQSNVDMGNSRYQVMKGELQSIFVQLGVKLAFLQEDLLKMSPEMLAAFFAIEPRLQPYRFGIEDTLRSRKHILPTEQQKIVSLTGLFSQATEQAAGLLNNVDLPAPEVTLADDQRVLLNMANYSLLRAAKNPADRSLVMRTFWANHKKFENTLAALLDGEIKQHLFTAKSRNYDGCLAARLFGSNIEPAVYQRLLENVRASLGPLHRYLQLKKKMLGLEKLSYDDIYASAVQAVDKRYTYSEAQDLICAALKPLGTEYAQVLRQVFANRWIDIYPNKDKESGAYSSGLFGVHPFIKINFNGTYDSVSTLAHELGHALHSFFSDRTQHHTNAEYPTFLAEIASTFNEHLFLQYMLQKEKDDLFKLFLIDSYLNQVRATIFRQTLFADFELAMHRRVEEGKTLTPDWLNEEYLKITRLYYGHEKGVMAVDDYIQNEWSSVPHFFYNYYVFQYSTGMIASLALADMVLKDGKPAVNKYLAMLKAGGSDYPLALLKTAGVDMATSEPTNAALKRFDRLVGEMEKIFARLQAKKK